MESTSAQEDEKENHSPMQAQSMPISSGSTASGSGDPSDLQKAERSESPSIMSETQNLSLRLEDDQDSAQHLNSMDIFSSQNDTSSLSRGKRTREGDSDEEKDGGETATKTQKLDDISIIELEVSGGANSSAHVTPRTLKTQDVIDISSDRENSLIDLDNSPPKSSLSTQRTETPLLSSQEDSVALTQAAKLSDLKLPDINWTSGDDSEKVFQESDPIFTRMRSRGSSDDSVRRTDDACETSGSRVLTPTMLADDEKSTSLTKTPQPDASETSGMKDSPNLSVTPIISGEGVHLSQRKTTSTPGVRRAAPSRRARMQGVADAQSATPTTDEELPEPELESVKKRKKRQGAQARKNAEAPLFKAPSLTSTKEQRFVIIPITSAFMQQLAGCSLKEGEDYLKMGVSEEDYKAYLKSSATAPALKHKRLSDVSSTSHSSAASSVGYLGDMGSSCSDSSVASKRSRLSILIEEPIAKHSVISPLPKAKVAPAAKDEPVATEEQQTPPQQTVEYKKEVAVQQKEPSKMEVGSLVLAKFAARTCVKYWPAKVIEEVRADDNSETRWKIRFLEDEMEEILRPEDIIPGDKLNPGQVITTSGNNGCSQKATITTFPKFSEKNISYGVKYVHCNNDLAEYEEFIVPFERILLSVDQARQIKKDLGVVAPPSATSRWNVVPDNCIYSPRRRGVATPSLATTPATPTTRRTSKRGGAAFESSACEETDKESPASKTASASRRRRPDKSQLISTTDDEAVTPSRKNPRQSRKGQLFKNKKFVLTQGKEHPDEEYSLQNETDYDQTETEGEGENAKSSSEAIFDRKALREMICQNGGTVLDGFPTFERENVPKEIFVISDRYCRTWTYLQAVVYGFPRLSYLWVVHSVKAARLQDAKSYALQVGFSKALNTIVEEAVDLSKLLANKHILVASKCSAFIDDWKPMLLYLGAGAVSSRTKGNLGGKMMPITAVLSDEKAPVDSIVAAAKAKQGERIPVVNSKWIIDSIIEGRLLESRLYE